MKKLLRSFLFLFFLVTIIPLANAEFSDVTAEHPYFEGIGYVESVGIVEGYIDGTYKPDVMINRAEFTKIIIESQFNENTIDTCVENNIESSWSYVFFPDVPKDAWFANYVCVAKVNNIVSGYPDGNFKPIQNISFVEASKIIVNTFGFSTASNEEIWYEPFVTELGNRGSIPTTILRFDYEITRGEMAEMIYRLLEHIGDKESKSYFELAGTSEDPEDNGEESGESGSEACALEPDTGPCEAFIPKYFFDAENGSCAEFIWGGCEGTVPFETIESCQTTCEGADQEEEEEPETEENEEPVDPCTLEPDVGECEAIIPRYFFNIETEACEEFSWGGCGGTVPFEDLESCQLSCELDEAENTKEFEMTAESWEFNPDTIVVEEGDIVRINITSIDVDHGFAISEYDINTYLPAGETVTVEFTANQVGTFSYFSSVFSGVGYEDMQGVLIVEEVSGEEG